MASNEDEFDLRSIPESQRVYSLSNPALDAPVLFARLSEVARWQGRFFAYWAPSYWHATQRELGQIASHLDARRIRGWSVDNGVLRVVLSASPDPASRSARHPTRSAAHD